MRSKAYAVLAMRVRRGDPLRVVPLPLTDSEWKHIHGLAELRRVSIEDLLREGLHLPSLDAAQPEPERHLRIVQREPIA
jgi:hypothetical protein